MSALSSPRSEFIIHIDAKSAIEPFSPVQEREGVSFCPDRVHRCIFDRHRDAEFIDVVPIPTDAVGKPLTRMTTLDMLFPG